MSAFLSKLIRVSDMAPVKDVIAFWSIVLFTLGMTFAAQIAYLVAIVARVG